MPRFHVGTFMKEKKEMREKVVTSKRNIEEVQMEILQLEDQIGKKRRLLREKGEKLRRLDLKHCPLQTQRNTLNINMSWSFGFLVNSQSIVG